MTLVDGIVIGVIVLAAIFGMIRGVVSQVMAIVGLVTAYFMAPEWGRGFAGFVQSELGTSKFTAEKLSIILVGIAIYIVARLIGYGVEKIAFQRVSELKMVNRLGGATLGAIKCTAMLGFVFFFLALLPRQQVQGFAPRLTESHTYRLAAKYNPMGSQNMLDRMRKLRGAVSNPAAKVRLEKSPLHNALSDPRFVKSLKEGDYDRLQRHEEVERLMRDDKLVGILDQIESSH